MEDLPEPLVEKLTHRLPEIRHRALLAVASKLECGQACGLPRTRQLLFNLFHYFELDECGLEKEALSLIERVLQSSSGRVLIAHIGRPAIRQQLNTIRSYIDPQFLEQLDGILTDLGAPELEVPPLCPKVPLSFRSDGCEELSTASTIQGLVQHSPSLQQEQACAVFSSSPSTPKQQRFPWQVLSESDEDSLRALEGALRCPKDSRHLEQSCESFSDELILNFPPEVFLQRPGIVYVLLGLLGSEDAGSQTSLVLRALGKLSRGLQARLGELSDNALRSFKDEPPEFQCVGQLPVEQFCAQGAALALTCLNQAAQALRVSQASLLLVNELLQLLQLVGQALLSDCLERLGDALEYFRLQSASLEHEPRWRRIYLHLLCISARFLPEQTPPRSLQLALRNSLLDVGLAQLFPGVHQQLLQIAQQSQGGLQRFRDVELIKDALSTTVQLLRCPPSDVAQYLTLVQRALPSVALHRSPQFLQAFVGLCARQYQPGATEPVLLLLANRSLEVRQHMYALCLEKAAAIVGARTPQMPTQVTFLLDPQIFEEIALFGAEVGSHAQEILLYLLKRPVLAQPQGVLALVPALPVLLCHADNATPFGRTLMELTNPDTARLLGVPDDALFRANILLLFSKEAGLREEAASRLSWLLARSDDARLLLPKLSSVRKETLSRACMMKPLVDVNKLRHSQHFYQPSSLQQMVEVLQSPQTDPAIRRSALNQLSVMLDDHLMHEMFLNWGGVALLTGLLCAALTAADSRTCPDSAIAIVGALRSLALYHCSVRAHLGADTEALSLLLRGLFVFVGDERMRQDAAILLFLLALSGFVAGSPVLGDLQIPALVQDRLLVPFVARTGWRSSRHRGPDLLGEILADQWSMAALQLHWHSELRGGCERLLELGADAKAPTANPLLVLSDHVLAQLLSSSVARQVASLLRQYSAAGSSQQKLVSLEQLNCYLQLHNAASQLGAVEELQAQPWQEVLEPDLTPPAFYGTDQELLQALMQLLTTLTALYKGAPHCWIGQLLTLHGPLYWAQLGGDCAPSKASRDLLQLIAVCAVADGASQWNHVLELVSQELILGSAQHLSSRALLNSVLSCLVHLIARPSCDWSLPVLKKLPHTLFELMDTLMGLNTSRHALIVLNQLANELQLGSKKARARWFWDQGADKARAMVASGDVLVRAGALQLFASLAQAPYVVERLCETQLPLLAVRLLVDHLEASIVRENAAVLLANLSSDNLDLRGLGLIDRLSEVLAKLSAPDANCAPRLVRAVCLLLAAVLDADLSRRLHQLGLINPMVRSLAACSASSALEMGSAVCGLLRKLVRFLDERTLTKDSLLVLLSLFGPRNFPAPPRNELWRHVLLLLAALRNEQALIVQALQETGLEQFFDALCEVLSSAGVGAGLQDAALLALVPLLPALAEQLDGVRSPICLGTTSATKSLLPGAQPSAVLEQAYYGDDIQVSISAGEAHMMGGQLCQVLINLYELRCHTPCRVPGRNRLVVAALTGLLGGSTTGKRCALSHGLVEIAVKSLRDLDISFSLKGRTESEIDYLVDVLDLLANLLEGCPLAKGRAASVGLADVTLKLLKNGEPGVLTSGLRLLAVFTQDSPEASCSIIRTQAPALSFVVDVIVNELNQTNHRCSPVVLQLGLDVLRHCFLNSSCRKILSKRKLLDRTYVAITGRALCKPLEQMWMEFLEAITRFPEGQDSVGQDALLLALIMERASNPKSPNHAAALRLLRNLAFYPPNRPRLLALDAFFGLLSFYITRGDAQERRLVLLMVWALAANNHRAKVAFKLCKLDACLEGALKSAQLLRELKRPEDLQLMAGVLAMLRGP